MTSLLPVDIVVELLASNGYTELSTPLDVAGLKFETQAAMIGASPSPDLVLIADTAIDDESKILRMVEGMARALDIMESKRPVSLILVGPRPKRQVLELMSRVCRVLPVPLADNADVKASVVDYLAVLLPLHLPEADSTIADPIRELSGRLADTDLQSESLIAAASHGVGQVQRCLYELIEEEMKDKDAND